MSECGGESPELGGFAASDSPASQPSTPLPHPHSDSSSPSPHASVARHVPSRSHGLLHRSTAPDSDPDDPELHSSRTLGLSDTEPELSPSAHVHYKDEPLSVSVVPADSPLDAHDSGLLSPSDLSPREGPVSVSSMIDATDFRSLQPEPIYQNLSSMNGRMSPPGFSPSSASSYATLTPLQPLPPISTVSDKFAYGHSGNVSGSFTVMQNNGLGNMLSMGSPYQYDKLTMSPPHYASNNGLGISLGPQHSPLSPHSYQNGLASPQKSLSPNGYDSPYTRHDMCRTSLSAATHSPTLSPPASLHHNNSPTQQSFSSFSVAPTPTLTTQALNMNGLGSLSPQIVSPHSPNNYSPQLCPPHSTSSPPSIKQEPSHMHAALAGGCQLVNMSAPMTMNQSPPHALMAPTQQIQTPIATSCGSAIMKSSVMATTSGNNSMSGEVEEINTKELAQRISAELKRYSIPQAIFAQRVLCRSQGTLSDLLRNPKPWSKLKSGRETFRRMWKWLQEPEFQRMSALRLAGGNCSSFHLDRSAKDLSCSQAGFQEEMDQRNYVQNELIEDPSLLMHSNMSMGALSNNVMKEESQQIYQPACKRKEEQQSPVEQQPAPKKPRLVFTDLQRRTLQAIFKETKRPSKEMQVTIARQLGLEPSTVGNFFMNARRRSMDKWKDDNEVIKITPTAAQNTQGVVHMTQMQAGNPSSMIGHCLDEHDL